MKWHSSRKQMELALMYIGMLIEFCDLNGYGQDSPSVKAAREFWSRKMQEMQR